MPSGREIDPNGVVDSGKLRRGLELSRRHPPSPDAPTGAYNVSRAGNAELYADVTDDMLVAGTVDAEHCPWTVWH